ncbi:DUF3575 domain-containing protein [Paenimyroides tangerinum]|uniref:DUF3575 domain-containing protein n=1 Tax=Paenimyroides tangerinum TaxID=2488728 RepID=A0A3P3WGR3_9FLAO|nr:DUF3575 domain-containing protein [Paenimyroides tangerinum]RRJ93276.1 DUF3575 domain-containing protein [Paenimyroides tangerinum]
MMKKINFLLVLLCCQFGFSQNNLPTTTEEEVVSEKVTEINENKNLVKLNLLALTMGNFSFQYERSIGSKFTIGGSINLMPNRKLPFSKKIESLVDDKTTAAQLQGIRLSSFSITPEARFYLGKQVFKGFYVAPFFRYGSYSLKFPLNYTYENQDQSINLDGKVNTISGGLAIGAQWKIAKNVYLDWLIMGPHFGSAKGNLTGNKALNADEQAAIAESLNDLDIPVVDYEYEVNANGAKAKIKGPWAGVRASIGIGYRF